MKRIYLACPYSDPSPRVRRFRFNIANEVAGVLMQQGHGVFSPISHCHPIAEVSDLPRGFDFWRTYDLSFIESWATHLTVITLEGWDRSVGVTGEVEYARELALPIDYFDHSVLLARKDGRDGRRKGS